MSTSHNVEMLPATPPGPDADLAEYTKSLLYRMHLTKGARYQSARRHQRRSMASLWAVIALSMYVFTTSIITALYDFSTNAALGRLFVISSVVMSAFIIAFSVLEQGKKHDLKADLFLRCAQGIQELWDELDFEFRMGSLGVQTVRASVAKYNSLVHDFSDNHSETDYRSFRINIGKHKAQPVYSTYHSWKYWMDCWLIMIVAILVPPMAFVAALRMLHLSA